MVVITKIQILKKMTTMKSKSYYELMQLDTFEERVEYLKLRGSVGRETFGYDRYLNQVFYKSREWRTVRDEVILRDNACDLGIPDRDIYTNIMVHHINPITIDDIKTRSYKLIDPNNLICTTKETHDIIHYSNNTTMINTFVERTKNDTTPWRR